MATTRTKKTRRAAKLATRTKPAPAAAAPVLPEDLDARAGRHFEDMVACRSALRDWLARAVASLNDLHDDFARVDRAVGSNNLYLRKSLDGTVLGRVVHFLELAELEANGLKVLGDFEDDRDPVELAARLEREAFGVK